MFTKFDSVHSLVFVYTTAKPGKFEIQLGGDDLEDQEPQVNRYDDVALDSLIDPKLMV